MPHQLWLIRHGETEWSRSGAHTGRTDIPLTDTGRQKAAEIGRYLAGRTFALVLTSPLLRARDTCRLAGFGDAAQIEKLRAQTGQAQAAQDALEAGLVTAALDELDWQDEVRQAIESRTALSPDALTGMEANLRFGLPETLETRIFSRLSAWQNWVFVRPNAVGESGALKVYGTGAPVKFKWERV